MAVTNVNLSQLEESRQTLQRLVGTGGNVEQAIEGMKEVEEWAKQYRTLTDSGFHDKLRTSWRGLRAYRTDFRELSQLLEAVVTHYTYHERRIAERMPTSSHESQGSMATDWEMSSPWING